MQMEQRKRFLINFAYFAVILGLLVLVTHYALGMLAPFIAALIVSLLLKPVVAFLRDKAHLKKGFAGVLVVLVFYTLIVVLLIVLGVQIFIAAKLSPWWLAIAQAVAMTCMPVRSRAISANIFPAIRPSS